MSGAPFLVEMRGVTKRFGGLVAVRDMVFDVAEHQVLGIIGPNGSGKSTMINMIAGAFAPTAGSIKLNGRELAGLSAHKISRLGVARTFQLVRLLPELTVLENLNIGAFTRTDTKEMDKDREWVYELFPILKERTWQLAGTLSGGEQQMLAVGRALMSRPKLLMMDEPSLVLAPLIIKNIFNIIQEIPSQ